MYVDVDMHGSDNSKSGLFICWNAGQVGIVGFDLKDRTALMAAFFFFPLLECCKIQKTNC